MDEDTIEAKDKRSGGWLRFLLLLALGAWVLRSLIVAPFSIPSASMLPTMWVGDYLFVSKWDYGFSRFSFPGQIPSFAGRVPNWLPDRGDVVVFKRPDAEGADWTKRVIGLPGDRIAMDGGRLMLNGAPVARREGLAIDLPISANSPCSARPGTKTVRVDDRPMCRIDAVRETLPGGRSYVTLNQYNNAPRDEFAEVTVPAGHLFLMGDNRDDSADSRYTLAEGGLGMVPVDRLVGRAAFAYWSTDGSADFAKPWTWASALRGGRLGKGYQ